MLCNCASNIHVRVKCLNIVGQIHATPARHNAITRPTGNTFKHLGMGGNSTLEIEDIVFSPFLFSLSYD